jgi:flagellar biogenesis protein FliO
MGAEGGVIWPVARALIALIGVCLLAWVTLLWLSRSGRRELLGAGWFSGAAPAAARLKLIERLALGSHHRLYLVQADERVFLLGAAESGGVSLIAELSSTQKTGGS